MRKVLLYIFSMFAVLPLTGQSLERSTVAASGDYVEKPGIQLSWTLGQPSPVETFVKPTVVLMQGFQQADIVTSVPTAFPSLFGVVIYPNPAYDQFVIQLSGEVDGMAGFSLIDLTGKQVLQVDYTRTIGGQWIHQHTINNLATGVYHCVIGFRGSDGTESFHHSKLCVISR
jgi:hypothetical protein